MTRRALRTVDLARAVGVHPNTIRLWERVGYLPPVPRSPTGYRLFTEDHLDQVRLIRHVMRDRWPGRAIRRSATALVTHAARHGLAGVRADAEAHLALIRREQAIAGQACAVTRRWLDRARPETAEPGTGCRSGEVTRRLHLTYDTLRGWERSGLYRAERDPATGERRFAPADLDRLLVIRTLRNAGYSAMAILRMLASADAGRPDQALHTLTYPDGDEDLVTAGDRWAATLADHERGAVQALALLPSP